MAIQRVLLSKALATHIDSSGPGTATEATIQIKLGSVLMAAGLLDEAGEQFRSALKIRETLLGIDDDSTKAASKWGQTRKAPGARGMSLKRAPQNQR